MSHAERLKCAKDKHGMSKLDLHSQGSDTLSPIFNFLKQIQHNTKEILVQNYAMPNAVSKECGSRCGNVENNASCSTASVTSEIGMYGECNSPARDESGLSKSLRCKRVASEIKEGNDFLHVVASNLCSTNGVWIEHACDWNVGLALRDLEPKHGTK